MAISNYVEELLVILSEECAEVIQIKEKIERFGFDSYNPFTEDKTTNIDLLHQEIGDVLTIIDLLITEGVLDEHKLQNAKIKKRVKLPKFMLYKPREIDVPDYDT